MSRGTNGTFRADVVPGQPVSGAKSFHRRVVQYRRLRGAPGAFGDARRNSIEGPGQRLFDMAFTKIFPISESRFLEFRAQFSNIFNTPQYLDDRHDRELADLRPGDFRGRNAVPATDGEVPLLACAHS